MHSPFIRVAPVLLALLLSIGPFAPARAADPEDVALLLARMRQATGGDAWTSVRTLHTTARTASGGEQETWEDVAAGRYLVRTGTSQAGFDGVTSWQRGRSGIAYALGDVDAALVAADESFRVVRAWWFRDRHPATIALVGSRSDAGRTFDVLSVTPEGGRPFEAWVDRSTALLARTDEQQAEDRVIVTYADYRRVGDLVVPFSIRTGDGDDPSFDAITTVLSVDVNPPGPETYAIPALPASDIQLPPGRDHVDVSFRLAANNRILVPVTLNERVTVDAEFDSGGSLLLQPASVARLGTVLKGRQKQSGGGEGSTSSAGGLVDSLRIGDARIGRLAFDSFLFHPDSPDEALVGLEVLQRFVVRFDFDRLVMTLTRPDAFRDSGTEAVVPFHFQDNQPEVIGSIDGIAGRFAIDTGDNSSLLLIAPFARLHGLVERYHADLPYGGRAIGATHGVYARQRAGTVALNGADGRPIVAVHDPVTRISLQRSGFDANRNVSANIGLGILRQFNVTFDYPRQRLLLEPNHFYGQRDIANRTGLLPKRDPGGWTVSTVYPESPAAMAGLVAGDRILRIDGRTSAQIDDEALTAIFRRPVGTTVMMEVDGAAGPRQVACVLRDVY